MFHIQTLNNIARCGLEEFSTDGYELSDNAKTPDAILLRSFDMHQSSIPDSLQVVGRAGAGTNNIPIAKMSERGIPVLNTPGANANAVKELVITGMLLACRNICPAWDYVRHLEGDDSALHEAVEKNKKRFAGFELPGKTLGVIGLGNIGVAVANVAHHLGMQVVGFDPAITVENAWQLHASVQQAEQLEDTLVNSDFVTIHVPLNDKTRNLINKKRLNVIKRGAVLLNFARDGIIDNAALANALSEEHLRNYVCDFPTAELKENPSVISLPHLGASTREAEENCAVMVARQIKSYLENGHIKNSVNFPNVKMSRVAGTFRIAVVNANVPNMVAQISTVLSNAGLNICDMINKSRESQAYTLIDVNEQPKKDVLDQLSAIDGVIRARFV